MLWCRGVEVGLFNFVKLQGKKNYFNAKPPYGSFYDKLRNYSGSGNGSK